MCTIRGLPFADPCSLRGARGRKLDLLFRSGAIASPATLNPLWAGGVVAPVHGALVLAAGRLQAVADEGEDGGHDEQAVDQTQADDERDGAQEDAGGVAGHEGQGQDAHDRRDARLHHGPGHRLWRKVRPVER